MKVILLMMAAAVSAATPAKIVIPHRVDPVALADELRAAGVVPESDECDAKTCMLTIQDGNDADKARAIIAAHKYRGDGARERERAVAERQELLSINKKLVAGTATTAEKDRALEILMARFLFP